VTCCGTTPPPSCARLRPRAAAAPITTRGKPASPSAGSSRHARPAAVTSRTCWVGSMPTPSPLTCATGRQRPAGLGLSRADGKPSLISDRSRNTILNYARKILRHALGTGDADRIGLDRGFIVALPHGGPMTQRTPAARSPTRPPAPWPTRQPGPARRHLRPARPRHPRHLGNDHRDRAAVQRGHQPAAGLRRPLRQAAAVVARPDKGRQLRRGDPHPRIHLPADHPAAAHDTGPLRAPARPPAGLR
jgi:hypothetical protein